MLNKLRKFFCLHHCQREILLWHYTHGVNGNEPAFIQYKAKCGKCGKTFLDYTKDADMYDHFEKHLADRKWDGQDVNIT